jgi:hypothetical protein
MVIGSVSDIIDLENILNSIICDTSEEVGIFDNKEHIIEILDENKLLKSKEFSSK